MAMSIHELDAEIKEIEARIAAERLQFEHAVNGCTSSLRDAVTSPKTLAALLGVGFGVGKLMFSGGKKRQPQVAPAPKAGALGLLTGLAGTALSLAQPRFGLGSVAKWAASRYLGSRDNARENARATRPIAQGRPAPTSTARPIARSS